MTTQIKNIKSNDFVPYFDFEYQNGKRSCPKSNCTQRSVRASQIANIDLDFGMLFVQTGDTYNNPFNNHGFGCIYSYHTWNVDDNNIYDSKFQLTQLGVPSSEQFENDDLVMVVDMEYLQKLFEKKGTDNQIAKAHKKVMDDIKKVQYHAKIKGVKHLYISGFSYSYVRGSYYNTKDWIDDLNEVEKILEKTFA